MKRVLKRWRAVGLSALLILMTLLPAAAAVGAQPLTVRVSDLSGMPVARAAVEVYGLDRGLINLTQTGDDGTVRLDAAPGVRQLWMLRVSAGGYRVAESSWFDPAYGGVRRFSLEPVEGGLQVLLHTPAGEAITGEVALLTAGGRLVAQAKAEDGRFVQTALPAGEYRLAAWAADHSPVVRTVAVAPGRTSVESVTLSPAGFAAVGEVVESVSLGPVSGAAVELLKADGSLVAEGATRADGRFVLDSPRADGGYRLRVTAPGYAPAVTPVRETGPGRALDFSGLDQIRLIPLTGNLAGTLLNEIGQPVARTRVVLLREGFGEIAATQSNEGGQFRFDGVPAGDGYRYQVVADSVINNLKGGWHDLLASDWITARPGIRLEFSVVARSFFALPLSPGMLTGHVTTPDGLPVEGATVELLRHTRVQQSTTTDAAGSFGFAQVEASETDGFGLAPYMLRVSKEGFVPTREVRLAGEAQTSFSVPVRGRVTVAATLRPSLGELKGRVTDLQGRPVAGASLALRLEDRAASLTAATDAKGWYRFTKLPAGALAALRITAPGYLPAGGIDATRALAEGSPLPTIQLSPRRSVLEGVLVDFGGKPVSGARVTLRSDGAALAEAQTGADGYYFLEADLTTTAMALLTAGGEGYSQGGALLTELPGPGERLSRSLLVQQASAVLEGRVLDQSGRPAAAAVVELLTEGKGSVRRVLSDPDGRYRFEALLPDGAAWVWLRLRPVTGSFAGSLSHGLPYAPLLRLTAGDRMVVDLQVGP